MKLNCEEEQGARDDGKAAITLRHTEHGKGRNNIAAYGTRKVGRVVRQLPAKE